MSDQRKLVEAGIRFIKEADGDVVFGSGPHRWKPIRYEKKKNGAHGVIFDSLGNFLHPSMASQEKNIIARILFSPETLEIKQIQAVSVKNKLDTISASSISPINIPSEIKFLKYPIDSDERKFESMYFNF